MAGRPPKPDHLHYPRLTVTIRPPQMALLRQLSEEQQRTMSEIVREMIDRLETQLVSEAGQPVRMIVREGKR